LQTLYVPPFGPSTLPIACEAHGINLNPEEEEEEEEEEEKEEED
jgi:hypothetical protein